MWAVATLKVVIERSCASAAGRRLVESGVVAAAAGTLEIEAVGKSMSRVWIQGADRLLDPGSGRCLTKSLWSLEGGKQKWKEPRQSLQNEIQEWGWTPAQS